MALSGEDLLDLHYAKALLESPGLAAKITNLIGIPIEKALGVLPKQASAVIDGATKKSLQTAMRVALLTLEDHSHRRRSADTLHKVLVAATGAAGGAGGFYALSVELPVSTTIMLRSIADIARSEGESIKTPEAILACLEVFAFGGRTKTDDASESAYFLIRMELAREVAKAAEFMAQRGLAQEGAPAIARVISKIASRFGIAVSEKAAAQAVPIAGAAGGAIVNALFMDHFQDMARGHFIVRRLERAHGEEVIRSEYLGL